MASRLSRAPVATDKRFRPTQAGGDTGPAERWQHSGRVLEFTDRAGVLAARVSEEHILDILALRRLIDRSQTEAGLRFKNDYHTASLAPHVTGSYTGMGRSNQGTPIEHDRTEAEEAAYRRWRKALAELGPRLGGAVLTTACYDVAPAPGDLASLQQGLRKLAAWYGLQKGPAQP